MSDEIVIAGKDYVSSKRASELSGYTQDYIGQLARASNVDAERIAGLWYVSMPSLRAYKESALAFKPEPPRVERQQDPESLISFDGKDFISAPRASKITAYHQDYVGQLARSGKVLSRQVGNRWYIERQGILEHKREKDALLGAVQAQSVGITSLGPQNLAKEESESNYAGAGAYFTYTRDDSDLIPALRELAWPRNQSASGRETRPGSEDVAEVSIPIHLVVDKGKILGHTHHVKRVKSAVRRPGKTMFYGTLAAAAFTIVIVLSFGFSSLRNSSMYALNLPSIAGRNLFTASAASAFGRVADALERLIVPELVYKRPTPF